MTAVAIGQVLARRIVGELSRTRPDGGPKLVVTNFQSDEVASALEELEGMTLIGHEGPVVLVADTEPGEALIAERFRLRPDRSLTWHRNNSPNGLVLFSLSEASDRQGLSQLYRLTDRSLLDGSPGTEIDPAAWLLEEAWNEAGSGGPESPPAALFSEAAVVYAGVNRTDPISLRHWAKYLLGVAKELRGLERSVDPGDIHGVLGAQLPALGMFPHRALFDDLRHVELALDQNRNCAAGRDQKGGQIPEGFLAQRIDDLRWAGNTELDESEAERLKQAMHRFAAELSASAREQIDFAYWTLLFDSTARREGLGSKVRQALGGNEEALGVLEGLDVEPGLDESDPDAAALLLEGQTAGGEAIVDLLPAGIRRRVERLAVPPSRLEADPLQALLRHLVHAEDLPSDVDLRLDIDLAAGLTGPWSLAVFRLVYTGTLSEVAEQSEIGDGRRLSLGSELSSMTWPEIAVGTEDDEGAVDPWAPVFLGLWMAEEETPRYRFRWSPHDRDGYAAFAAIVRGHTVPIGAQLASDIEEWSAQMAETIIGSDPEPRTGFAHPQGLAAEWLDLRERQFALWASEGLGAASLFDYVEEWSAVLQRARDELIPTNSAVPDLDDFLDSDSALLVEGRAALLASHPLRLRWLAGHLQKLGRDLAAALASNFQLNKENDQLYFEAIGRVSPHRQPPMLVTGADEVLAASGEFGLHEEYMSLRQGDGSEAWIGVVDEGAIRSLADTVGSYLSAFPYKHDGLGLLLLVKNGDPRLPERLIRQLVGTHGSSLVVELHIVAPRSHHQAIAQALSEPGSEGDRESELLPRLRLTVHEWPDNSFGPLLDQLAGRVDLALVPNLFGAQTQLQAKTRPRTSGAGGRFDPWLDVASHGAPVAGGENVSRILLPASPDPALEAWSTLNVRRYLQSAVAPETPENTDYFTLQVTFDRNRLLFEQLHDVAHWVVTLDPFVGRDQIDALDSPPDVILVQTGLGKNKTHTLVVSSRSGRAFVVRGLERKLRSMLGFVTGTECSALAERLYDLARNTVPGITLRALGLGRGVEEILGLTVTRFAVEEHFPAVEGGDGFEWWLSLDDHLAWFGGSQGLRADLMRVQARVQDGELQLEVEIVESKFRRQEDLGTADRQLDRTIDLLESALAPLSEDSEASDAVFWRRELVAALDETSRRAVLQRDLPALRVFGDRSEDALYSEVRDCVLDGAYSVTFRGIACGLATETEGPTSRGYTPGGYTLLRMTRDSILGVLHEIAGENDPTPRPDLPGPSVDDSIDHPTEPDPPGEESGAGDPAEDADGDPDQGLTTAELEDRYQQVLDAFHEFRVGVEVPDGVRFDQGPGFYVVRVRPAAGVTADKLMGRLTDLKLRLDLPHELDIRAYPDRGAVVFEIPKLDEDRYDVDAEELWGRTPVGAGELAVAIGEDQSGAAVVVNFSSSDSPHLLVAGTTGSGKSIALETILKGLCRSKSPDELQLHLVDPKGTELVEFEDEPHLVGPIGMDAPDAIATLTAAVEEMQRRYAQFKAIRVRDLPTYNQTVEEPGRKLPWWLVVLDEYADLTADPEEKRELETLLRRLAQKARAAGLHVLVATQRPSADVISPIVRSNLPAQLALRVRTGTDSRVILDESGAEALAGRGDALLRTARGIVRLQVARVEG